VIKDGKKRKKKIGDYEIETFDIWPKDTYSVLYIDGNNMLFLTNVLRHNTLRRKKKRSETIISNAVEEFSKLFHFDLVVVIYDNTNQVYEKILENGTKFSVISAIPNYPSSDDALVIFNENQSSEVRNKSLVVTSDRGLSQRLSNIGTHVTKCKMFFNAAQKEIPQRNNVDLNEWFANIDQSLERM